jgi:hypothetical protein
MFNRDDFPDPDGPDITAKQLSCNSSEKPDNT